jgi:hypothetical protein
MNILLEQLEEAHRLKDDSLIEIINAQLSYLSSQSQPIKSQPIKSLHKRVALIKAFKKTKS